MRYFWINCTVSAVAAEHHGVFLVAAGSSARLGAPLACYNVAAGIEERAGGRVSVERRRRLRSGQSIGEREQEERVRTVNLYLRRVEAAGD